MKKKKSVLQYPHEQARKKKKILFWVKTNVTGLLLLFPYSLPALHQQYGSYRIYVLSSSLLQEIFLWLFSLCCTPKDLSASVSSEVTLESGKKNPMNLFLIVFFANLLSVMVFVFEGQLSLPVLLC